MKKRKIKNEKIGKIGKAVKTRENMDKNKKQKKKEAVKYSVRIRASGHKSKTNEKHGNPSWQHHPYGNL